MWTAREGCKPRGGGFPLGTSQSGSLTDLKVGWILMLNVNNADDDGDDDDVGEGEDAEDGEE